MAKAIGGRRENVGDGRVRVRVIALKGPDDFVEAGAKNLRQKLRVQDMLYFGADHLARLLKETVTVPGRVNPLQSGCHAENIKIIKTTMKSRFK